MSFILDNTGEEEFKDSIFYLTKQSNVFSGIGGSLLRAFEKGKNIIRGKIAPSNKSVKIVRQLGTAIDPWRHTSRSLDDIAKSEEKLKTQIESFKAGHPVSPNVEAAKEIKYINTGRTPLAIKKSELELIKQIEDFKASKLPLKKLSIGQQIGIGGASLAGLGTSSYGIYNMLSDSNEDGTLEHLNNRTSKTISDNNKPTLEADILSDESIDRTLRDSINNILETGNSNVSVTGIDYNKGKSLFSVDLNSFYTEPLIDTTTDKSLLRGALTDASYTNTPVDVSSYYSVNILPRMDNSNIINTESIPPFDNEMPVYRLALTDYNQLTPALNKLGITIDNVLTMLGSVLNHPATPWVAGGLGLMGLLYYLNKDDEEEEKRRRRAQYME